MTAPAPPAPAARPEAASYLAAVEAGLAGLPPGERADLIDDLAGHLAELSAEGPVPLHDVLGPPEAYAAELLATLGVAAQAAPGRPGRRVRLRAAVDQWALVRAAHRMWDSWGGREASSVGGALRPAWWILRAYFAVSLVGAVSGRGRFPGFPFPTLFNNAFLGTVSVLAAIPVSVRLGRLGPQGVVKALVVAGDIALVVYGGSLLQHVASPHVQLVPTYAASPLYQKGPDQNCMTNGAGQLVTNLYPYTMDGKLTQVLLYDQTGRPIDNLCPFNDAQGRQLNTQYAKDANGASVYNAVPRAQTVTVPGPPGPVPFSQVPVPVTSPVPPPAIVIPQLAAPPTATATPAP